MEELEITVVEGTHEFEKVQLHHTMMGREIVKETTLADFINDPSSGNHRKNIILMMVQKLLIKLHFGMNMIMKQVTKCVIDLSLCSGCLV